MGLKLLLEKEELWLVDGDIYELIDIRELRKTKRIEKIHIKNVKDFRWLKKVLGYLSIERIEGIIIQECDLEELDISIFEKMNAIQKIRFIKNNGIDYNSILKKIPNIKNLKEFTFWDTENGNNDINLDVLKENKDLMKISLRNISNINYDELSEIVSNSKKLEEIVLDGEIKRIDFTSEVNLQKLGVYDEKFDLSLITPEIAKKHEIIWCKKGKIQIGTERYGAEYVVTMNSECIIQQYENVKELIEEAEEIKLLNDTIRIKDKTDLNWVLNNKNIIKKFKGALIEIPHIGLIEPSKLRDFGIDKISVRDFEKDSISDRNVYTQEEYKVLHKKINKIIEKISQETSELQKFMMIYKAVATKKDCCYREKDEQKEYYTDILYNCLNAIGIECCKVGGEWNIWNKVKIGENWYNADLNNDMENIEDKKSKEWENCLISDMEMEKRSKQEEGRKISCDEDYPRDKIQNEIKKIRMIEENNSIWKRIRKLFDRITKRKSENEALKMLEKKSTHERRDEWIEKEAIKNKNTKETSSVIYSEINLTKEVVDREFDD